MNQPKSTQIDVLHSASVLLSYYGRVAAGCTPGLAGSVTRAMSEVIADQAEILRRKSGKGRETSCPTDAHIVMERLNRLIASARLHVVRKIAPAVSDDTLREASCE